MTHAAAAKAQAEVGLHGLERTSRSRACQDPCRGKGSTSVEPALLPTDTADFDACGAAIGAMGCE